jgi:hypothetical protein
MCHKSKLIYTGFIKFAEFHEDSFCLRCIVGEEHYRDAMWVRRLAYLPLFYRSFAVFLPFWPAWPSLLLLNFLRGDHVGPARPSGIWAVMVRVPHHDR